MDLSLKKMRKQLSMPGLLSLVKSKFKAVKESTKSNRPRMAISDCLMSALAMFSLKYPSLLSFNDQMQEATEIGRNIKQLFDVSAVPSDTYMRERLDEIDVSDLRSAFTGIFSALQRGKVLEEYKYIDDAYLVALDGTGLFSSKKIHCEQCNVKKHRNGKKTYYHQMLSAVLLHPEQAEVIPFAPEAILKGDGTNKNDCERNAAKRLLTQLREEHPHLKLIITEDALSSNGPHIKLLQALDMHYILGVKPGDHKFLFDWIEDSECNEHEEVDNNDTTHRFKFINGAPLNGSHSDLSVNFLEYWEIKKNGTTQHFSWVTDFELSKDNIYKIMKGGRARWKIENETFNTLKNQGYHFEHNYGHGNKNLCTILSHLMILAFLIDQVQQRCCRFFKEALQEIKRKKYLWERMRNMFAMFQINSWEDIYLTIIHGVEPVELSYNST